MSIQSHYFKVIPELQDYVDFVVYFECSNNFFTDRLLPSTHVVLFINAECPIILYPNCDKKQPILIKKGVLKGLHERPYGIELGEFTRTLSIRFKPCAAYSLLLEPMSSITNRIVPAEEMKIPGFAELHNEFNKTTDPEKIENMVNEYLMAHLKPTEFDRPRVFCALDMMKSLKTKNRLPDLAKGAGVSTKHLNFLFDKYIGLSPKKLSNILRFNELLQQITNNQDNDWMTVVEKFGYYDQSHFIRDFKKFTCLTPTEFINDYHFIDNNLFRKDMNEMQDVLATV